MNIQVDIDFEQLLKAVQRMPVRQLERLRKAIEQRSQRTGQEDLEALLLAGPTATSKQLETIAGNRKALGQWRGK
ncbi:MAG: hypothetical protein KJZ58_05915 [Flavobacteriales bacterium]|nr:hypothetical protein [Flavobacteriales bacterium]MCL4281784.1 hypothetical protein [Flavobacteriales bacterium]